MLLERLADLLPGWVAWPASALSTAAAIGGSIFMFLAAANGEWGPVYWAGFFFGVAAVLWYLADMASANRTY